MMEEEVIERSLSRLLDYVEREEFKGFDPYDGLSSPLFKLPLLNRQHTLRFYAQQALKRSPVNVRPLLGIKKSMNPVSAGLGIQAYSALYRKTKSAIYREKTVSLLDELIKLIPPNYKGACWGYDFPWEARYATIPAYQPTIVATGIITNSLFIAYHTFQIETARDLVTSACEFACEDLHRSTDSDGTFCFSYSPFDQEKVFNASMKGSRLLAQGFTLTKNTRWKELSTLSVAGVMKHQTQDGAWIYSQRDTGGWVDNYHTGYILDCLDEYIKCTGDITWEAALKKGLNYYVSHFLTSNGQPSFYNKEIWPADCTAGGQTLLSLSRFGYLTEAKKVALWMSQHMQSERGNFYFRRYRRHVEKTAFMRWSDAWMLAGLAELTLHLHSKL